MLSASSLRPSLSAIETVPIPEPEMDAFVGLLIVTTTVSAVMLSCVVSPLIETEIVLVVSPAEIVREPLSAVKSAELAVPAVTA